MRKKGQMEILGLAIVVILLILGMVFVIKFVALKKPSTLKQEVVESQAASNYISTYFDTTIQECPNLNAKDLLLDCASGGGIDCSGVGSCEKAKEVAEVIFSKTFDVWKTNYYFTAYIQESASLLKIKTPCTGAKRSKTYPLPTRAGTMSVRLDICGIT